MVSKRARTEFRRWVKRWDKRFPPKKQADIVRKYAADPIGYIEHVLGYKLWEGQKEVCRKLLEPPYRVLVKAGHSVGKTFLSAALVSWFYDTFDPSYTLSSAPAFREVVDILWKEIRLQRGSRGGFVGDSAPLLWSSPAHLARGMTAGKPESFQGRHQSRMFFVFDEAVGINPVFFETVESMMDPSGFHHWLSIFNPTDSSSQVYAEEQSGRWHVVTLSCLAHPNVIAGLNGETPPFPGAVSLKQVEGWLAKWAEPINEQDRKVTDIEWPLPGTRAAENGTKWLRPGPLCESRVLGRWPSQSTVSVWSDALWQAVLATQHQLDWNHPLQFGVDVAREGDDYTVIHARCGLCSIWHEAANGWSLDRTAGRIKQLCNKFQTERWPEKKIPVLIDQGGFGVGVVDMRGDYNFIGVNSSQVGNQPDRFKNRRSELWWAVKDYADRGGIDVSRLDDASKRQIGRELLAPRYSIDATGRIVVEEKSQTKKRLGGASPDNADGLALAYYVIPRVRDSVAGHIG